MPIGLDVGFDCSFCGTELNITPKRRYLKKQGREHFFCNRSCSTSYKNLHNNPMQNPETRKKLSRTMTTKGKWTGSNNPNFGGFVIRELWDNGTYNSRDLSGSNNPAWIDGRSLRKYGRGPDWNIQRLKALKRDSFQCQKCPAQEDLVVHHITPYAVSKNNSLENLIVLCQSCHGEIHMKIGWNYFSTQGDQKWAV